MRVLAIGECMAELAPMDTDGDLRLGFAGDTFNTAWYLARCAPDAHVSYLTALGDDAISQKMAAFMRDSGIDDRFVQVAKGRTVGLYMITLDEGERSFSYWRGQSAAKALANDPAALLGGAAADAPTAAPAGDMAVDGAAPAAAHATAHAGGMAALEVRYFAPPIGLPIKITITI